MIHHAFVASFYDSRRAEGVGEYLLLSMHVEPNNYKKDE